LLGQTVLFFFYLSQELSPPLLAFRAGEAEQLVVGAELAEAKNRNTCHLSTTLKKLINHRSMGVVVHSIASGSEVTNIEPRKLML
jgi:hypothetical protein